MRLDDFNYHLPQNLIAQQPADPRDSSKLLVINRSTQKCTHHIFNELPQLLSPNDVLVRNNTKVIPARIYGKKKTGGNIELLLLKRVSIDNHQSTASSPETITETWECMSKPGLKKNQRLEFENSPLTALCVEETGYTRQIRFELPPRATTSFWQELLTIGHTPLPPYITWDQSDETDIRQKYQTIYAQIQGSAAAPTAGLHFTQTTFDQLAAKGISIIDITLHVGLGTFLPVKSDTIENHHMHEEIYEVSAHAAKQLQIAHDQGKNIIAVGTTSARVLETIGTNYVAQSGSTDIFIYPPYQFTNVSALLTNFHLPKSTLLMMISAFISSPNTEHKFTTFKHSLIGKAYQLAIDKNYRFFSFGDAMLIR